MNIRITEQITTVREVSYDLEAPASVFHECAVEAHRGDWQEVHSEVVRTDALVTNIEEA